jgi:phosphohistidine swiveling domain-containing protein
MLPGAAVAAAGAAAAGSAGLMPVTPSVGSSSAVSNETTTMPVTVGLERHVHYIKDGTSI